MNISFINEKMEKLINKTRKHSAIQIYDNKTLTVEICMNIYEFNENCIKLELATSILIITGLELCMRNFNIYGVEISGDLHSITFEQKNGKDKT